MPRTTSRSKVTWTPDSRGRYFRSIGWRQCGGQPKFYLGRDLVEARERERKIRDLWIRQEAAGRKFWLPCVLQSARMIAEGIVVVEVPRDGETPEEYAKHVELLNLEIPEIIWIPNEDDLRYYRHRVAQAREAIQVSQRINAILSLGKQPQDLGQTLHQALVAYREWLAMEKFDPSEGHVNDTGKKRQDHAKRLKEYLADCSLVELRDFSSIDKLFDVIRKRPVSQRYKRPIARKTAHHWLGELKLFFRWLHHQPDWDWTKPEDFDEIKREPRKTEADTVKDRNPLYSLEELKVIYRYSTDLERLLILLAINCAFGRDQIGRLRIGEIRRSKKSNRWFVRRVRRKSGVIGKHLLWTSTVQALQWAIANRTNPNDYVILNGRGKPLWRKTKGGHRATDMQNAWYRLIRRIRKDIPSFPLHGFNTLRDLSGDFVLRLGGAELAHVHLTHGHFHSDRNLRNYVNPNFAKLFKVHAKLELRLASVFAENPTPFGMRKRSTISRGTIEKIRQLREAGQGKETIAKALGLAKATVERWMDISVKSVSITRGDPTPAQI